MKIVSIILLLFMFTGCAQMTAQLIDSCVKEHVKLISEVNKKEVNDKLYKNVVMACTRIYRKEE